MSPEFSALIDTKIVTESLVLNLFLTHFIGEANLCDCRENRDNRDLHVVYFVIIPIQYNIIQYYKKLI